ncbi:TadE/TadG family type IV pilus assembly protein [Salipiger marinus]|uniref:TadE/TadG family type IV pilus assembly protein n=1 Tax=Salipiger marinus TaxID=555512 RepID=UPI002B598046|nr:TadE/TadG family type IV pilus assembly protein [Salipiger manganoxidans]MEB3419100.1 TadE/TadG family type IV pilus assembly protein [Salipiger manganoxidans]
MRARLTKLWRSESGAAAVEFALVGLIAISLLLAILEFGRGFYMRSAISYAADVAARTILMNQAVTEDAVKATIRDAITFGTSEDLEVDLDREEVDGVAYMTMLIRYPLTLFIPTLTDGGIMLTVSRRIPLG